MRNIKVDIIIILLVIITGLLVYISFFKEFNVNNTELNNKKINEIKKQTEEEEKEKYELEAKKGIMKASAAAYEEGIGKLMQLNMAERDGDFYIYETALEKKVTSPFGKYVYYTKGESFMLNLLNSNGYVYAGKVGTLKCGGPNATGSFIRIEKSGSHYVRTVCLYDDKGNYVFGNDSKFVEKKN